jgi:hypothetical protein
VRLHSELGPLLQMECAWFQSAAGGSKQLLLPESSLKAKP